MSAMRVFAWCIVFDLALAGGIGGYQKYLQYEAEREQARLDRQQARLTVDRPTALNCMGCPLDVFVNGFKVGSVGSGDTAVFHFDPSPDGNNSLFTRVTPKLFVPSTDSKTVSFKARPGSRIYVRDEIGVTFSALSGIVNNVEVGVQDPVAQVAEPAEEAKPAPASGDIKWDPITGIATIIGTVATVLALIKTVWPSR